VLVGVSSSSCNLKHASGHLLHLAGCQMAELAVSLPRLTRDE
jgi:hypothetical protein